jgi:hypothetical protein
LAASPFRFHRRALPRQFLDLPRQCLRFEFLLCNLGFQTPGPLRYLFIGPTLSAFLVLDGLEKKCIVSTVQCEYDPDKSARNLEKHGICFEIAKELWSGKTVEGPAKSVSEARSFAIGRIGRKFWTVIHTTRGKRTRIISARRSTKNEIEFYTKTDASDDSRES